MPESSSGAKPFDLHDAKAIATEVGSLSAVAPVSSKGLTAIYGDDRIIVPLRTMQRRIAGNQDAHLILVSAQDGVATEKVKQDIERLLRERRHIAVNEDDDFSVLDTK